MLNYRFIREYANYIIRRLKENNIPGKESYIHDVNAIVNMTCKGLIIVNECMEKLVSIEKALNNWKRGIA